ncbi:MAG: single-stranded-DNA-specific exonuclease RecJ [Oscillospiraceae bacterium]|nr:single-stranded-DNA-specific exonuclease RecJ [Oscillospiraceae bacterium]
MKKWSIGKPDPDVVKSLMNSSDLSRLCAQVLASRSITNIEQASRLLQTTGLEDPFVLKDMEKAAEIINNAINDGIKICIYGDYDCDGVTSSVMLFSYLECLGADVDFYIPERSEGYGLNEAAVKSIADNGTQLIITVDNGISAVNEADLISELGMQLIITDHHQPGEVIPNAQAVINPHQSDCPSSFKNLCGAGVTLKLIAALEGGDYETAMEQFGDLAAIGTVGDIVSLTGENRYIVQYGTELIKNTERCGLIELMRVSGLLGDDDVCHDLSSESIAFMLVPRINAAGRFGSPKQAFSLLNCDDPEEAEVLAGKLNCLNNDRKKVEEDIMNEISASIERDPQILSQRVLVFSGEGWHHGVIGIVASKLIDKYGKPCFVITREGEQSRGSARSFGDFSVYDSLCACSELLIKFGGHPGAGGFSLDTGDIEAFTDSLYRYAFKEHNTMPAYTVCADKLLLPEEATVENAESLHALEPFGEDNRKPLFAVLGAVVTDIVPLAKGAHTKLRLSYGNLSICALMFRTRTCDLKINIRDKYDFIASLDVNTFKGNKSLNLLVCDYRKSGIRQEAYFAANSAYEKYLRDEPLPDAYYQRMLPQRNDLISVYSLISDEPAPIDSIYMKIDQNNINYCKLRICIDIFSEMELIKQTYSDASVSKLHIHNKVNLENSNILRGLREKWGTKAAQ